MNKRDYEMRIVGKDATKKAFKSIEGGLGRLKSVVTSTTSLIGGGLSAGALAGLARQGLVTGDALAKVSDKLGIATEQLAGLRFAAEQTAGVSAGTLDTALQRLVRRTAEAAQGTGEAKNAIKELGLDAQVLAQLSPDQQFRQIADAMQGVAGQGDRVRLAMRLFDTEGVALVNTLAQGSEGLDEFQMEAEKLGITLSRFDAAKIEQTNDAFNRLKTVTTGIGQQLAVQFSQILTGISNRMVTLSTESGNFRNQIAAAMEAAVTGAGLAADGVQALYRGMLVLRIATEAVSTGAGKTGEFLDKLTEFRRTGRFQASPNAGTSADDFAELDKLIGMLDASLDEGRLSERLRAELAKIKAESNAAAQETVRALEIVNSGSASGEGGPNAAEQAKLDKERERIAARLAVLERGYLTEIELLQVKLGEETRLIQDAVLAEELTREEANARTLRASQRFQAQQLALEAKGAKAKAAIASGSFKTIANSVGQNSGKIFKITQALSLAQSLAALPTAIIESFKNAGGYPWGILPAAAMASAGAAQIASIRGTSLGGGGSVASIGGGGGISTPTIPQISPSVDQALNPVASAGPSLVQVFQINGSVVTETGEYFTQQVRQYTAESGDSVIAEGTEQYDRLIDAAVAASRAA